MTSGSLITETIFISAPLFAHEEGIGPSDWTGPSARVYRAAVGTPAMRARLLVLAAAVLWSTGGAAIKAVHLSAWQVAGFRSGIAALTVLALVPASRRFVSRRSLLVGAAYAATLIAFVASTKLTTAGAAIFLQSSSPLYLLVLGPWLLREPVRRKDLLFIAVFCAGIALFFAGSRTPAATAPDPLTGNALGLLSGLFLALAVTGLRWLGREAGSDAGAAAPRALVAGNLLALVVLLPLAVPIQGASWRDGALLVFLGVFQIGVPYILLTRAIRHVEALEVSLLVLIEPVLNPVWAWVIHGETLGPLALCGGAVILAASIVKALRA